MRTALCPKSVGECHRSYPVAPARKINTAIIAVMILNRADHPERYTEVIRDVVKLCKRKLGNGIFPGGTLVI